MFLRLSAYINLSLCDSLISGSAMSMQAWPLHSPLNQLLSGDFFVVFGFLIANFGHLDLVLEISPVGSNHLFAGKCGILPIPNLNILSFEFLVVLEEVLRNAEEHLVHIRNIAERTRVERRNAKNLVVFLAAVGHVERTNDTAGADRSRNHGRGAVNEHIQSIAIVSLGTRDKPIRAGVAHGAQEASVETKHVQAFVVFILQIRVFADFHDAIHFVGILASDRKI